MKKLTNSVKVAFAALLVQGSVLAQGIPPEITTPDRVETSIGTLEYKDGAPSVETAKKLYDSLDFVRAVNVYNNSFRGASALAIRKGFQSIGAEDNTVVIFSGLMDSNSLFLTANADTVYYVAALDLSKGPLVLEQPSNGLGTINDMWFSWVIDIRGDDEILSTLITTVPCLMVVSIWREPKPIAFCMRLVPSW